jgi:cobalt/nickel transport system permease protein
MTKAIHKRHDFIERSMMSALSLIKDATLYEEFAARKGFFQSLDPRMKTVSVFAFLLTAVFLKSSALIGCLYVICLLLAISSHVPIPFFLIRTWVFVPLFSLCIVIPTLFSQVTPGEPFCAFHVFGAIVVITRPGLTTAVLFVVRVTTSVSLVVLLSLTTRHGELLKVARIFGIPQVFVLTVSMCYRYLYLFATIVENIFLAIRSRVGIVSHHKNGQKIVGWNIANTWFRTTQMSEDVYKAMLSRGYTGEPRLLSGFQATYKDWFWMSCAFVICAGLFYFGQKL